MAHYYFEFLGDLEGTCAETFDSKEAALETLAREWGFMGGAEIVDRWGNKIGYTPRYIPDPEDDRVLLWEVSDEGRKLVWHFSGWHWSFDAEELPGGPLDQGSLPTDYPGTYWDKPLYSLAMEDY